MVEVDFRDVRSQLSALLDRVEKGEEIIIKRRGKTGAKMDPPPGVNLLLGLKDFRASPNLRGKRMSQTVIDAPKEERY